MLQAIKNLLGIGPKIDYAELVKNGAIILDVRTKGEFEMGHIKGSVNIPINSLSANIKKLKDKNRPIIACCASGSRSSLAKSVLKNNGFSQVHNGGSWYRLQSRIK